ncbi:MAG: VOC family protein [candidate division Zixibacteria bacterium]|nr:VOC family protein [candidate division Zixibacteria bacterium]
MFSSKFIWYELNTPDPKAAEVFYGRVLECTAREFAPGAGYTILSAGGADIGGIMAIPENACEPHARPAWVGYIGVSDTDDAVARLRAAGGSVFKEPTDIPGVGRFAVVADPHGAVFLLMKGAVENPPPPVAPGTPGHVGWHELHAGDGKQAFSFYSGIFGWTPAEAMDMGEMGVYQIFATGNGPVGGMMTKMPEFPAPSWLYYFNVTALDAAIARVKENGGQVLMGPHEVPGGQWIAQCLDPQGAMFALLSSKR